MRSEWLSTNFCKKGMPPKKIHEDFMENLGKESPSYRKVKTYRQQRLKGERVEGDGRFGRPKDASTVENVKVVHTLVMCDRRRDLQNIAREVGIRCGAVQSILTDILGMSKVSARWVPRMLTDGQKKTQHDISRYLLSRQRFYQASCNPR